jgi:hypothetical protein
LVERLRNGAIAICLATTDDEIAGYINSLLTEAADEIEQLGGELNLAILGAIRRDERHDRQS